MFDRILNASLLAILILTLCAFLNAVQADDSDLKKEDCWIERDAWIDDNGDKQIELNIYCSPIDNPEVFDIVNSTPV